MAQWHEEVLTIKALRCANALGESLKGEFYLGGGTAIALRLGHRVTLDFNLFSTHNSLALPELQLLLADLQQAGDAEVVQTAPGTAHILLNGVPVSLFHDPTAPLRAPSDKWRGLLIAHLPDLAAMKLGAVLGRGSKEDFIDLYALSQSLTLEKIFAAGIERYPLFKDFPLQAARALVYFDDAEREPMPKMLMKVDWDEMRRFFEQQVTHLIRQKLV